MTYQLDMKEVFFFLRIAARELGHKPKKGEWVKFRAKIESTMTREQRAEFMENYERQHGL